MRCFVGLALLLLVGLAALPSTIGLAKSKGPTTDGSLKGALRALERRRRAPQGPSYSLASFQDRDLEPMDYYDPRRQSEGIDRSTWRDAMLGYLDRDEDYPTEDPSVNYKSSEFREFNNGPKKMSSAFRELQSKNSLEDVFAGKNYEVKDEEVAQPNDDEYAELLRTLWEKYRFTHEQDAKRAVKKRSEFPPSAPWGPVPFKRKRSSNQRLDNNEPPDFLYSLKFVSQSDPAAVENLKDDKVVNEEEDSDIAPVLNARANQAKYSSGFEAAAPSAESQPVDLEDEQGGLALQPLGYSEEMYLPEGGEIVDAPVGTENLYAVAKRSSLGMHGFAKRNLASKTTKTFRSTYNDPKIMKDLSGVFGGEGIPLEGGLQQSVVKRSSGDDVPPELKPPIVMAHHFNESSHETMQNESDHQHQHSPNEKQHPHSRHEHENKPPLMTSNFDHSHEGSDRKSFEEVEEDSAATHIEVEHPIVLRKKSIDWSDYFGLDLNARRKKSMREIAYPNKVTAKQNVQNWSGEKKNTQTMTAGSLAKLDAIDNKLKNIESGIVDEALELGSGAGGGAEDDQLKLKLLEEMKKTYTVEKMRKALKELKSTLQREGQKQQSAERPAEMKEKRSEVKPKTRLDADDIKAILEAEEEDDFGSEQGAGHFLNGPIEPMSEGYMPGGGDNEDKGCPILDRIIKRCHNVDVLAGDHGQLFLPLCSLHQVCYICGPSSRTGCDLAFLSEADSACAGHARCHGAARGALMALRELHEPLAHYLRGECAAYSCLNRAIKDFGVAENPEQKSTKQMLLMQKKMKRTIRR